MPAVSADALALAKVVAQQRRYAAAVKESGLQMRTVLIEFDSLDAALTAYDSPGYKEALSKLGSNAIVREIRIIEGI